MNIILDFDNTISSTHIHNLISKYLNSLGKDPKVRALYKQLTDVEAKKSDDPEIQQYVDEQIIQLKQLIRDKAQPIGGAEAWKSIFQAALVQNHPIAIATFNQFKPLLHFYFKDIIGLNDSQLQSLHIKVGDLNDERSELCKNNMLNEIMSHPPFNPNNLTYFVDDAEKNLIAAKKITDKTITTVLATGDAHITTLSNILKAPSKEQVLGSFEKKATQVITPASSATAMPEQTPKSATSLPAGNVEKDLKKSPLTDAHQKVINQLTFMDKKNHIDLQRALSEIKLTQEIANPIFHYISENAIPRSAIFGHAPEVFEQVGCIINDAGRAWNTVAESDKVQLLYLLVKTHDLIRGTVITPIEYDLQPEKYKNKSRPTLQDLALKDYEKFLDQVKDMRNSSKSSSLFSSLFSSKKDAVNGVIEAMNELKNRVEAHLTQAPKPN